MVGMKQVGQCGGTLKMQMKKFDRDFVERTKWIIQNVKCPFEVTLLLNCMLGLVNLPTERAKNAENSGDFQDACAQKLEERNVIKKKADRGRLFRSPRNAVSHLYICPTSIGDSIEKIILSDNVFWNSYPLLFSTTEIRYLRAQEAQANACNINRISVFNKKHHASNPPSPTSKKPWNHTISRLFALLYPLLNTLPETVRVDRTNGAAKPLKWCKVTAAMVHWQGRH